MANRANVHMRLIPFKLFLSHFTWALDFEGPERPGPTSRAMYLELVWKSRGVSAFGCTPQGPDYFTPNCGAMR
ncbi:hypothetical protein SLH49_19980, partial [Cognatiyoonia sp. IB215446]|uniref:hypothetical protein n=1 Tax=Cognatiyoonia sp. IB215446 TaxID=3097355 RepID=UPI002A10B20B